MSDGLFYLSGGDFLAMRVAPYDAEEVLQELVESHPDLLAGGQMTPSDPRRWLLVKREHAVPDSQVSTGRWSVDHLFVTSSHRATQTPSHDTVCRQPNP